MEDVDWREAILAEEERAASKRTTTQFKGAKGKKKKKGKKGQKTQAAAAEVPLDAFNIEHLEQLVRNLGRVALVRLYYRGY